MSDELLKMLPKCTCCGKIISPEERSVKFVCPNCGKASIWRSEKCQMFVRSYTCPRCGFVGP